jgi:S-DNA-T family DNA segregation ATPase FtsK/SpoIIIE
VARNTLKNKEEEQEDPAPKASAKKSASSAKPRFGKLGAFLADRRVQKILGIFLVGFSIFTLLACVSYLFTGEHDLRLVLGQNAGGLSTQEPYKNLAGKMGAHVAWFFMNKFFGIGALFLPLVLFLIGVRTWLRRDILPFWKSVRLSVLGMLYFPLAFGFVFHHRVDMYDRVIEITCNQNLVGGYGHFATEWCTYTLGWMGTLMGLLFVAGAFAIFNFNHQVESGFARLGDMLKREPKAQKVEEEEEDDEPTTITVRHEAPKNTLSSIANSLLRETELEELEDDLEPHQEPFIVEKTQAPAAEKTQEQQSETVVSEVVDGNEQEAVLEEVISATTEFDVAPQGTTAPLSEKHTPSLELETEGENEAEVWPVHGALAAGAAALSASSPIADAESNEFTFDSAAPSAVPAIEKPDLSDLGMEVELPAAEEELSEHEIEQKMQEFGPYDPKLDLSRYELPALELLKSHGSGGPQINKEELEENKNRIVETLNNYKIEIAKIKATIGPTVTLYEIVPAPGVRISKIKSLEDDIALSLSALGIRIIAPIPGKGTIGIEVPNSKPDIVSMRSLIASDKFQNADMELPVVLGKTIQNEIFVTDLAKMPHLLMAGATGQGKSVGLNAILVSLLYKKHPSQIKFVLVDPKKVELTLFNKIERHFLAKLPNEDEAIITDTQKVVKTLQSLCIEMDNRYELLKNAGCRNIKEYNGKFVARRLNPENGHRYLPYIVLVVDEFADLIMTAGREVETPIARLAQLARAIGIHLIIATQRPSVNIITGVIKANFPARIAFRVTSKIDSRTILDAGGADQLIGRGDMLFSTGNDLTRIQCGFVDTPEVEEITEYIGNQQAYPSALLLPEVIDENALEVGNFADSDRDELFEEAARIVVLSQQGSASLLQRKLKLGYNRAGRLVDQLEAAGVIGPFEGSKARKVLIPDEIALEQFLKNSIQQEPF